jgi:formylglycine-generating enzyme required for sulfatase activity
MPSQDQLPRTLQPLVRRNALELSNTRFRFDLDRISEAVRKAIGSTDVKVREYKQWEWPRYGGLVLLLTSLGIVATLLVRGVGEKQSESPANVAQPKPEALVDEVRVTQERLSPGTVFRDRLKNGGEGPSMVVIPAGSFQMGDVLGVGDGDERPVHRVMIEKTFAIGQYEVTFDEYDRFAEATVLKLPGDSRWGRGKRPVIAVSWEDATRYAEWLSEETGKSYRLPTEAEWEYSARAKTNTTYWWGNNLIQGMANCSGCGSQWNRMTATVGSFKPNKFGLYDTAGNVWEWVQDCWHDTYHRAPTDGSVWLQPGGGDCGQRVVRGGSWSNPPSQLRASYRDRYHPDTRNNPVGFRLARDLE